MTSVAALGHFDFSVSNLNFAGAHSVRPTIRSSGCCGIPLFPLSIRRVHTGAQTVAGKHERFVRDSVDTVATPSRRIQSCTWFDNFRQDAEQ